MEEGHQHCEDAFLAVAARYGLCRPAEGTLSLEDILRTHSSLVCRLGLIQGAFSVEGFSRW